MSAKPGLLIVDDDTLITDTLSFALGRDFAVTCAESRFHAIKWLQQADEPPALALVDLGLPPTPHRPDEGYRLIGELLAHAPGMRIFVLSGQNAELHAKHARALGAVDFLAKPVDADELRRVLFEALKFQPPVASPANSDGLIGNSPLLAALREQVRQYAPTPFPVLIEGESGSGKELVAASLHRQRAQDAPYFALNCAAISETLLEPTLFGYAKGAFTGAANAKAGYFEEAGNGTLFLDEIGELPLELQPKLLRVLENGEFQRVGETQQRTSQARIIAATNRDLRREIRDGRFRADLYHRLSVFTLQVPPLRDLQEDKLLLLQHFRGLYAAQNHSQEFELTAAARAAWLHYGFPGNVRELRNIVIRLTTRYPGIQLNAAQVEAEFDVMPTLPDAPLAAETPLQQAMLALQQNPAFNLDAMLKDWELAYIEAALKLTQGNVSQAAKLLGINRTTLYSRMENHERLKG